ncbi:hypothetical protein, partial [Bartonella bovis]|uniref:hypothetical protein n=1 Tax=Bartonella bovis TaxID=155194 RepID=UPI00195666B2
MESSGTLNMTGVTISNVEKGVEATAGNLMISGNSTIMFMGSGHGVKVGSGVTANLTDVTIRGEGAGGNGKGV